MIVAVDVDYRPSHAIAACVAFSAWGSPTSDKEWTARVDEIAPYEPGAFYKRELPCLVAVLRDVTFSKNDVVIVDGYVTLDASGRPGLGAYLYEALSKRVAIVGVAKTAFRGAPAVEVVRGASVHPLYVSAIGVDEREAGEHVRTMHGEFRVPTLLKRVDALARAP